MKYITLEVPKPFSDGPQYEGGELVPGSWPAGLPHEGIQGWRAFGEEVQGLMLCDFLAGDDYPVGDLPGGWRATSSHIWDFVTPFKTEVKTDQERYELHQEVDFHRMHGYAGWPDVDSEPVEVVPV